MIWAQVVVKAHYIVSVSDSGLPSLLQDDRDIVRVYKVCIIWLALNIAALQVCTDRSGIAGKIKQK